MKYQHALSVVTLLPLALGNAALAEHEHVDIWLHIADGEIITGTADEDGPIEDIARVFGAELGEDPDFPFSTDHPGCTSVDTDPLDPYEILTLNIYDHIGVWNGGGFDAVDETMTIAYGGNEVTSGFGYVPGIDLGQADEHGHLHLHAFFTLNGYNADPDLGVYLLPLTVSDADLGYVESKPFWILFNLGMDESVHDAAVDWAVANLVPAPGSAGLVLAGLMGRRSRRRR